MPAALARFGELAVPACLVAVTAWLWTVAGQFKGGVGRYEVLGPSFFPKILLGALAVVSLMHIARMLVRRRPQGDGAARRVHWRSLAVALGLTLAYAAVLGVAGFLAATAVFQALLLALVFGYRRPALVVGLPLGMTALYGAIFLGLMNAPLPRGRGLFADFSGLFY